MKPAVTLGRRPTAFAAASLVGISLLAGCAGGSTLTPAAPLAGAQAKSQTRPAASCPCLYAPNWGNNSVTVYASGAHGDATPIQAIAGSSTDLDGPTAVALDSDANVYVANYGNGSPDPNSITVYNAGANGNVTPRQLLSGSNTGLSLPDGIAIDPLNSALFFVANFHSSTITAYSTDANGNEAPSATLGGSNTGLSDPSSIAFDSSGDLYVANFANSTVTVYAPGSSGNVAPKQTISGGATGLNTPDGITVDSKGNIYVANWKPASLLVYAAGANGNVSPIETIHGKNTELSQAGGIALDSSGDLYVSNEAPARILEFAPGATGNVAPLLELKGKKTGLSSPTNIIIH